MRFVGPSIKTMLEAGLSEKTAQGLKTILRQEKPWREILEEADTFLGTYGVESVYPSKGRASFSYLNNGDTYALTLLYRHDLQRFYLGSWGDEVERLERKGVRFA